MFNAWLKRSRPTHSCQPTSRLCHVWHGFGSRKIYLFLHVFVVLALLQLCRLTAFFAKSTMYLLKHANLHSIVLKTAKRSTGACTRPCVEINKINKPIMCIALIGASKLRYDAKVCRQFR